MNDDGRTLLAYRSATHYLRIMCAHHRQITCRRIRTSNKSTHTSRRSTNRIPATCTHQRQDRHHSNDKRRATQTRTLRRVTLERRDNLMHNFVDVVFLQELARRQLAALIPPTTEAPPEVEGYCELSPLEPAAEQMGFFGMRSTCYKATSMRDYNWYCLRRVQCI